MFAAARITFPFFLFLSFMPLHIHTPLLESSAISEIMGRSVWLKMEALQPSGSFKIRGIGFACEAYRRRGAKRFISSSGGNAGLAVAYAGRCLSVPVIVVVPESTSPRAQALIRLEQAQVVVHGKSWMEAHTFARALVQPNDALLHPFDDPLIWTGHASMVDEVANAGFKPDIVVLSVGGGGLLCGVVEGLYRNGWHDVPVCAVQTIGADAFSQSLREGRLVSLAEISSVATSLGAKTVCTQALRYGVEHRIETVVLPDQVAATACLQFINDHRVVVEPACGVALSAVYEKMPLLLNYKKILVIVCGGVGATVDQLQTWARKN